VDDLQSPTQKHLREVKAEERLRSYTSDAAEAWGIVLVAGVAVIAWWWAPPWLPFQVAVLGVAVPVVCIVAWIKRKAARGRTSAENSCQ
jgi:hypothetical protein